MIGASSRRRCACASCACAAAIVVGTLLATQVHAQIVGTTTIGDLRAKAAPDECFDGIGKNRPVRTPPCRNGREKVNQSYVWSLTQSGDDVWFGTAANPQCLTSGGLTSPSLLLPYRNPSWVCEFGRGPYSPWPLPAAIGDFRPPRIFVYSKTTQTLTDVTPRAPAGIGNPFGVDPVILRTVGIRGAATIGNLVLLGGVNLLGGLNLFAFRADTREFLGSKTLSCYSPLRQFVLHEGELYAAVGRLPSGGSVLRWTGAIGPAPCHTCFEFEVVGHLDAGAAYIAAHEDRLYVTTWPNPQGVRASLYMSPPVPPGGLTAAHAVAWRKVWDAADYEPDPTIARTYAGGALASFDGYLYWGTLHIPWLGTGAFLATHGMPRTAAGWVDAVRNTFRTGVLFRGRHFDTTPEVSLLYGWPVLPTYRPGSVTQPGRWELAENRMPTGKRTPLYGAAGFGNPYNTYIWSMAVWDRRLWIGTMDWSYPAERHENPGFEIIGRPPYFPDLTSLLPTSSFGADLYFVRDSRSPAVPEHVKGLGNHGNFGVRNLLAGATLFAGMANPSNLRTGPGEQGGWELIELQRFPGAAERPLLTDFTCATRPADPPGEATCTVAVSHVVGSPRITISRFPLASPASAEVRAPAVVTIPTGLTQTTFTVRYDEPEHPAVVLLMAELRGGTIVAPLQVTRRATSR